MTTKTNWMRRLELAGQALAVLLLVACFLVPIFNVPARAEHRDLAIAASWIGMFAAAGMAAWFDSVKRKAR